MCTNTSPAAPVDVTALVTAAPGVEVIAVLLCWRIVRDFRQADQSWDPRAAMSLRDQNDNTSASPS